MVNYISEAMLSFVLNALNHRIPRYTVFEVMGTLLLTVNISRQNTYTVRLILLSFINGKGIAARSCFYSIYLYHPVYTCIHEILFR